MNFWEFADKNAVGLFFLILIGGGGILTFILKLKGIKDDD